VSAPLKIGILGASRIAAAGIVEPARTLGHKLHAVAARDRNRAEAFAAQHSVAATYGSYSELINDPEVDLIYNGLINSAHAQWNIAALQAGKHVLSEKPLTGNAQRSREVIDVARSSEKLLIEGFHYIHHPIHERMKQIVRSGELGTITDVEITLAIPPPPDADPRWEYDLAGGATMDLGCYVLDALRHFGNWVGHEPELIEAETELRSENVDAAMNARLQFGSDIVGRCRWDMNASKRVMTWTIRGSAGVVTSPAFAVPHSDARLLVEKPTGKQQEKFPERTSYSFQLERFARLAEAGAPYPAHDLVGSEQTAQLVDRVYELAKMPIRPGGKAYE